MKIKKPPNHTINGVVQFLQPYCPELTSDRLLKSLRSFSEEKESNTPTTTPGTGLTVKETASRLNCSVSTVWRLIKEEKLPKKMLGRRSARIPEKAVIRLMEGGGPDV